MCPPLPYIGSAPVANLNVRGMDSVIVTVSGYPGLEKFNLIKLISYTGAIYVGSLSRSNTHLVCWEFKGKKYNLSRILGTKIISHRWFEDCLKEGRRLPEDPYIMKCGKNEGRLSWSPRDAESSSKMKCKPPREEFSDFSEDMGWSISHLLNEPGVTYKPGISNGAACSLDGRSARKSRRLAKKDGVRSSLDNEIADFEDYHINSTGFNKRGSICFNSVNLSTASSSSNLEGGTMSRKRRQPGRTNNLNDDLPCQKGHLCTGNSDANSLENRSQKCADINNLRKDDILPTPFPSLNQDDIGNVLVDDHAITHQEDKVLYVGESSGSLFDQDASMNSPLASKEIMQDSCLLIGSQFTKIGAESVNGNDQFKQKTILTPDLSCVICFTEFSSSRAVLPCGHRFCYSCIQDWADHLIVDRKVPTCPLCKANFTSIKKMDDSAFCDQKIYSQSIPCSSSAMNISVVPGGENYCLETVFTDITCLECHLHEPEELLISCCICNKRWVHSCCLDPPLVPWTCVHCRDLGMFYQLYR